MPIFPARDRRLLTDRILVSRMRADPASSPAFVKDDQREGGRDAPRVHPSHDMARVRWELRGSPACTPAAYSPASHESRSYVAETTDVAGVEQWHAGMTPVEKIGHIYVLQAQGRTVLMVGDGLNDAASLAAADVGLSLETAAPRRWRRPTPYSPAIGSCRS